MPELPVNTDRIVQDPAILAGSPWRPAPGFRSM